MRRTSLLTLATCVTLAAGPVSRADDPSKTPDPKAAPADADALRGPAINKSPDRPERSIVERDFQGRLKKLEEPPALVALGKLHLTPEEKKQAEKVVGDRAAVLDTIVRDNLKIIVELAQAKQSGDADAGNRLQAQVLEKAAPFFKRGPLLGELKGALSEEHFAELGRMVREYTRVAADDRMGDPMAGPKKDNRFGAMLAQGFEGFAAEARASFERVVGAGGKEFEALIQRLSLSPQQESRIRQKAGDLFQKTYGKPTKLQQLQLFLQIWSELDTEQRNRLSEYIGEENKMKRGTSKK